MGSFFRREYLVFFFNIVTYGGTPLKQSTHVKSEQFHGVVTNEEGVFQSRNLTGFSIKRELGSSS
jgi:hypothetical protein